MSIKFMKSFSTVFLVIIFSFFSQGSRAQGSVSRIIIIPKILKAEVVGIQDGDTIELKIVYDGKGARNRQGKNLRIRLLHVDCPEKGESLWKQSKQFTSDLSYRKTVSVLNTGSFDRYGRLLGEVVLPDGKVLNKELVKAGMAIHFKKYSSDREYAALEVMARKHKLGVWKL